MGLEILLQLSQETIQAGDPGAHGLLGMLLSRIRPHFRMRRSSPSWKEWGVRGQRSRYQIWPLSGLYLLFRTMAPGFITAPRLGAAALQLGHAQGGWGGWCGG